MNLRAVDRVVKIVRELDRYHGFVAAERRLPEPSRIEAPVEGAMTFGAALVCRAEFPRQDAENQDGHEAQGFPIAASARDDRPGFPSQDLEKIDSAPGAAIPVAQDALRVNCAGDDGDGPTSRTMARKFRRKSLKRSDSAPEAATPVRHHAFGLNPIRHCEDPLATTQRDNAIHPAGAPCVPGWLPLGLDPGPALHDGDGPTAPDGRPENPAQHP